MVAQVDRTGGNAYRVAVRGAVADARPFLKAMNAPDAKGAKEASPKEIEADIALSILTGYNDEALTNAAVKLNLRGKDVRGFVRGLEQWLIGALDRFGVEAGVREGRVGVWVERKGPGWSREDKIAAIGVKVRKWVSFHGISLNVEPDLTHFDGIVPCGITQYGVTSLVDLGLPVTMDDVDVALRQTFDGVFGDAAKLTQTCHATDTRIR